MITFFQHGLWKNVSAYETSCLLTKSLFTCSIAYSHFLFETPLVVAKIYFFKLILLLTCTPPKTSPVRDNKYTDHQWGVPLCFKVSTYQIDLNQDSVPGDLSHTKYKSQKTSQCCIATFVKYNLLIIPNVIYLFYIRRLCADGWIWKNPVIRYTFNGKNPITFQSCDAWSDPASLCLRSLSTNATR